MDRLDAMNAFVTVADLRGFAPAARRLRISPSAITRTIAALEEHLGARLLQRTTRSVTLTDAGARFLERARRILSEVADAESATQAERGAPIGRLVVTAPNLFGRLHVAPALSTLLARHPQVTGELLLSDRPLTLVEEGIDAAVRIGVLEDSSLVARLVGATRRVIVGAPRYLGKRKIRTPDELQGHALIQLSALHATPEWRVIEHGAERRLPFSPSFVTNSADAAIGHALLGCGLTMALAYQVEEHVRQRALRVVLADYELPPLPIHVVFPSARLLSPKVRALVEHFSTCDWRFLDL